MPYIKAGDSNVHYIEAGTGAEPVVFVHGNWVTATSWEPVLERLPLEWRGIAYDLRGRGQTEGPDTDYTMPQMAADLRAFCDALGLGSMHLVGHSLGSAVAMQFTLENPSRVRSLTAVAPAWVDGMPEVFNSPEGQRAIKADKGLFSAALKAMAPTAPTDDYWQRVVDEGHEQRLEAALRNLPALTDWRPGDRLKETGVPALVICGSDDPLTGGANAKRAAEVLQAHCIILAGVGHSPNIEAPDRFVELLREHISSVRGAQR